MSQLERISYIDRKIRQKIRFSLNDIANHFEISTRQIKRDIEFMRDRLDIPIIYNRALNSYEYETECKKLMFADQNRLLIYVVLNSLVKDQHYVPLYSEDIVQKVAADVPKDLIEICDKISYGMPHSSIIEPDIFFTVCTSLKEKKAIKIAYKNLQNVESERLVEPEHIKNYEGSWYMIAYDCKSESLRTFHLSRIKKAQLTNESFILHPASYAEELKVFLNSGYGIFMGTQNQIEVKIRFTGRAKQIVQHQEWNKNQKVEEGTENGIEYLDLSFLVTNFSEIIGKILSFGAEAKPVYPNELVSAWKDSIKAMCRVVDS